MLSLFKTRDLYETGAFYRIEKNIVSRSYGLSKFDHFRWNMAFIKQFLLMVYLMVFLIYFLPIFGLFPENSGLDVLYGAFYMSFYYILQEKKL